MAYIDVDIDGRVIRVVCTRERDEQVRGRSLALSASDLELCTLGIELRNVGLVESKELVADHVFTS